MSRKTTLVAALGAAAMIAGALGPWATERGILGESSLPGTDYGGAAVVLLALLVVPLAVADRTTPAGVCALVAALWIGIVIYGAPGALLSAARPARCSAPARTRWTSRGVPTSPSPAASRCSARRSRASGP
jgi:hypothetical protein